MFGGKEGDKARTRNNMTLYPNGRTYNSLGRVDLQIVVSTLT